MSAAFPDAMKIALGEEPHRRERNRAERRLDRFGAHAPTPAAGEDARRELGLGDASRVKGRKSSRAQPRRASRRRPRAAPMSCIASRRPSARESKSAARSARVETSSSSQPASSAGSALACSSHCATCRASRRWSTCEGKPRPDSVLAKSSATLSAINGSEPARDGGRSRVITVIMHLYRLSHSS